MLVGCRQRETVVGHMVASWQNVNNMTSLEMLAEKFRFQKKITSLLAKHKCLRSQAMEEKETRSSSGINEHSVTAFGRP